MTGRHPATGAAALHINAPNRPSQKRWVHETDPHGASVAEMPTPFCLENLSQNL
jgi:hypothetical protein